MRQAYATSVSAPPCLPQGMCAYELYVPRYVPQVAHGRTGINHPSNGSRGLGISRRSGPCAEAGSARRAAGRSKLMRARALGAPFSCRPESSLYTHTRRCCCAHPPNPTPQRCYCVFFAPASKMPLDGARCILVPFGASVPTSGVLSPLAAACRSPVAAPAGLETVLAGDGAPSLHRQA